MTSEATPALPAAHAPAHAAPEPAPAAAPAPPVADPTDGLLERIAAESAASTDTPPAEPEAPAAPAWPHQHLDFRGDRLEIRKPRRAAVAALQLTLTSSFTENRQNENTARFLSLHMSPASLARVTNRMLDPDDDAYPADGDYLDLIVAMIEAPDEPAEPATEAPPAG